MANAQYLPSEEAETGDFEEYQVSNAPITSADLATDSLVSALNDVSGSATVSIHRQNGSGKEALTFLDSFAPDKYSPDDLLLHIKNCYGTGDYRIHVRDNGKLKANKHVSIEAPQKVSRETHGNSDNGELLAIIQRQQAQIVDALRGNQNQGNSKREFLEEMMMYKQLFSNDGQPQKSQGFNDILQTVNGLKELGINVGGIQTEKEEGFTDILDKMSPMLTALIQNGSNQQAQPQPQYKPNPIQPEQQKAKDMNLALKMGLAMLLKAARNNADTAFYADLVMDQLPTDKIQILFSPDALEQLEKMEPKIKEFKAWFADVLEHIKGMNGLDSKYSNLYENENTDLTGEAEKDIKGETTQETVKDAS